MAERDEITNETNVRRTVVWNVARRNPDTPLSTLLAKKTAAIVQHPQVHPIQQAKLYKALPLIQTLYENESNVQTDKIIQDNITRELDNVELLIGDVIRLPERPRVFAVSPVPIHTAAELCSANKMYEAATRPLLNNETARSLFTYQTKPISTVSLSEFEALVFENRVLYQYYINTSFATYVYQNILYSLNASNVSELEGNLKWQARLAHLIFLTSFNDFVAKSAFYNDKILYDNLIYDTSFIPTYDVNSLMPIKPLQNNSSQLQKIDFVQYHEDFIPSKTRRVPTEYIPIFLTFPFKQAHYVNPEGRIALIEYHKTRNRNTFHTIESLCSVYDIEGALDDSARTLDYEDVLAYAINAPTIERQGVALLILRRMIGLVLPIQGFKIALPSIDDVLNWTKLRCATQQLLLPTITPFADAPFNIHRADALRTSILLVKDIASSCSTAIGATLACSPYSIPECDMRAVFEALTNDAERYVFITILLQQYNSNHYGKYRERLKPVFGSSPITFEKTDGYITKLKYAQRPSVFNVSSIQQRLDSFIQPLITTMDNIMPLNCPPYRCIEYYKFPDRQLEELATYGDTALNDFQYAAYLSLLLDDPRKETPTPNNEAQVCTLR